MSIISPDRSRLEGGDCNSKASVDETNIHILCPPVLRHRIDALLPAFALKGNTTQAVAKHNRLPRRICATPQGIENTDKFVARVRILFDFARLHKSDISEQAQLDEVYGLLHSRIKTILRREQFSTFHELLYHAHKIENKMSETSYSWYDRAIDVYRKRYGITMDQSRKYFRSKFKR